jgi:hypothetical protein
VPAIAANRYFDSSKVTVPLPAVVGSAKVDVAEHAGEMGAAIVPIHPA